jgi:hypothetical protein
LISLSPFLAWFTLKGAENRAFNWIENPRVGGSNPPSGTIFPVFCIISSARPIWPVVGFCAPFVCNWQRKSRSSNAAPAHFALRISGY